MRKNQVDSTLIAPPISIPKSFNHSLSTEESPRLPFSSSNAPHKEKSQLCKKYLENGYCPYKNRCKFAHGQHELKKNQVCNKKYKTKICEGFMQSGFCTYGNRCNFIHPINEICTKEREVEMGLLLVIALGRQESRLLKLLQEQG